MDTGAGAETGAGAASAGRLRRASSFGTAAGQYAQHRPDYAEEAIRWCLAPVGWVAELAALSNSATTLSRWRAIPDADAEQGVLRAGSRWFAPVEEGEFGHGQLRSADSLVAVIATYSRMLVMDEAERAKTLATIRDFLDRQPETSAGEFTLPLLTVALRAVRRP